MGMDAAKYLRVMKAELTDDYVEKRKLAIKDIVKSIRSRKKADEIASLCNALTSGFAQKNVTLTPALRDDFGGVINKHAPSFVFDGSTDLEILIVGCLSIGDAIAETQPDGSTSSNMAWFACALKNGFSLLAPKKEQLLESLRVDLISVSQKFLNAHGEAARERVEIDEEELPEAAEGEALVAYSKRLVPIVTNLISGLRFNAELDREEVDHLWWALNDWSTILNSRITGVGCEIAAVVSGIEFCRALTSYPPMSYFALVAKNVPEPHKNLALPDFAGCSESIGKLLSSGEPPPSGVFRPNANVFPLLWLIDRAATVGASVAIKEAQNLGLNTTLKLSSAEWARRSLAESFLLKSMGFEIDSGAE